MKRVLKYIFFTVIIVWTYSCSEYEMVKYEEDNRINFMGKDGYTWSDDTTFLHYNKNFGINTLGDSLLTDTITIGVKINGITKEYPRKVAFKTESSGDYVLEVNFLGEYVMPANSATATFRMVVRRPAIRGTVYSTNLKFDYNQSDFKAGTLERQVFKLAAQDKVNLELWDTTEEEWNDYYQNFLGSYSETKIRYLITRYHKTSLTDWVNSSSFTDLKKNNQFYTDYETYRQDPNHQPLIDENTGNEIEFPNLSE